MKKAIEWDFQSPAEYRKNLPNGDILTKKVISSEVIINSDKLGICYSGFNEDTANNICYKIISKSMHK